MPYFSTEKQKEVKRLWYKNVVKPRREKWLKENGPCRECGSWQNLEVDHIDPLLKVSHNIWSWAEERREKELKKCQVLCDICHDKKTNSQRGRGFTVHGSMQRGYRRGCKCEQCRNANSARVARRRKILAYMNL